jgi:hypothetical protein
MISYKMTARTLPHSSCGRWTSPGFNFTSYQRIPRISPCGLVGERGGGRPAATPGGNTATRPSRRSATQVVPHKSAPRLVCPAAPRAAAVRWDFTGAGQMGARLRAGGSAFLGCGTGLERGHTNRRADLCGTACMHPAADSVPPRRRLVCHPAWGSFSLQAKDRR